MSMRPKPASRDIGVKLSLSCPAAVNAAAANTIVIHLPVRTELFPLNSSLKSLLSLLFSHVRPHGRHGPPPRARHLFPVYNIRRMDSDER